MLCSDLVRVLEIRVIRGAADSRCIISQLKWRSSAASSSSVHTPRPAHAAETLISRTSQHAFYLNCTLNLHFEASQSSNNMHSPSQIPVPVKLRGLSKTAAGVLNWTGFQQLVIEADTIVLTRNDIAIPLSIACLVQVANILDISAQQCYVSKTTKTINQHKIQNAMNCSSYFSVNNEMQKYLKSQNVLI